MLEAGIKGYNEAVVPVEWSAKHIGSGSIAVLSTPMMIALMERTARESVTSHLEPGQETVGTRVDVRHMAATPVGATVRCETEVIEVDRRRIVFRVAVYDAAGPVGEGLHERFVIDVDKFLAKSKDRVGGVGRQFH